MNYCHFDLNSGNISLYLSLICHLDEIEIRQSERNLVSISIYLAVGFAFARQRWTIYTSYHIDRNSSIISGVICMVLTICVLHSTQFMDYKFFGDLWTLLRTVHSNSWWLNASSDFANMSLFITYYFNSCLLLHGWKRFVKYIFG